MATVSQHVYTASPPGNISICRWTSPNHSKDPLLISQTARPRGHGSYALGGVECYNSSRDLDFAGTCSDSFLGMPISIFTASSLISDRDVPSIPPSGGVYH